MKPALAILASLLGAMVPASASAQGLSPQEALARMTVPPGFSVRLFASEPDICQPVAMEFDDRGRLWVIQYLQYPNPAGLKRVAWDRYSRTTYDRVPEPPPHGPRGADRITICEDTDGDGQADRFHDFIDGLNLATGLAFGNDGVYVLQVPYLLFYPDADRNDVPDGDPKVLLTGFGMEDAHSVANSLTWGPDGWLYGAQGSTVTAHIRNIEFQQGVWRYHPPTDRFELFYEGGGNTWGVDFDAAGNLLACTNVGGYAFLHGVPGGYYWKSFGKHGELHNPHAYGYFEHIAHAGLTGAHVTCGGVVYQETAFPDEFHGALIAANLLSHRVDWHSLTPAGSTFTARQEGTLLESHDDWFAPCDVTIGPEGAVYVADWHDQRTAHPDPDAQWDRTNGRVYVVEAQGTQRPPAFDLRSSSTEKLLREMDQAGVWHRRRARRILTERNEPAAMASMLRMVATTSDSQRRQEALWTLLSSQGFDPDPKRLFMLLNHHDPDIRRWIVRWLNNELEPDFPSIDFAINRAQQEDDLAVRIELAALAQQLPGDLALRILAGLLTAKDDAEDTLMPLLIWWALERQSVQNIAAVRTRLLSDQFWATATFRRHLAPRLARRWAAEGTPATFEALAQLLAGAPEATLPSLLEGINLGLSGVQAETPPQLGPWLAARWGDQTDDPALIRTAALLGSRAAQDRARQLAGSPSSAELQAAMIELVGRLRSEADVQFLLELVVGPAETSAQIAALAALANFDDPQISSALLSRWTALVPPVRSRAVELLFSRPASALTLLEAVEAGSVQPADVPVATLQSLATDQQPRIDELIRKHWGQIGAVSAGEVLAEVRRLNNDLRAATGDPARGRLLYREQCGKCHRLFNEGQAVGPDLTTANRQDRDYLLVNVVDPSAVVRKEYLSYLIETSDGRSLTGLIVEQSPQQIVLIDPQGNRLTVETAAIESMEPAPQSLMPQRQLDKLTPQDVRDLFSFLQASEPPPE